MVRKIALRNLGPLLYTVVETIGPSALLNGEEGGIVSTKLLDLYESLAGGPARFREIAHHPKLRQFWTGHGTDQGINIFLAHTIKFM